MGTQVQLQADTQVSPANVAGWQPITVIVFRFVFLYFVLYNFPFPIGWIPGTDSLYELYSQMWHGIVPWVGSHLLHLSTPIAVFTNGSGDTTYDYVLALIFLTTALAGTVIWSFFDRRRDNYRELHAWLVLGLRLVLGGSMLLFGSVKVFPVQFREPSLSRLLEPYGDSSPMGLLWTFMGASRPYATFTGLLEMAGGALLILPRLATLGTLVSLAALINVFMLNLSYDVPVKLYSLHLLLMSLVLLAPEARLLANVLVWNRPTDAATPHQLFRKSNWNRALLVFQLLFGTYIAGNALYQANKVAELPKPPFYGIWTVEEFAVDGVSHPPLVTDAVRWYRVVFDEPDSIGVQLMPGNFQRLRLDAASDRSLTLTADGQSQGAVFAVARPADGLVALDGKMDGRNVHALLRRTDMKFLLRDRGFHWVNQSPFNK